MKRALCLGGDVGHVTLYDAATASVKGEVSHFDSLGESKLQASGMADLSHVGILENSQAFISDRTRISHLTLKDNAQAIISTSSEITHLNLYNNSRAFVKSGKISSLRLRGNSQLHVKSMDISQGGIKSPTLSVSGGTLIYTSSASAHIYANNVKFSEGKLSGTWQDGTDFEFWLVNTGLFPWSNSYRLPKNMPGQIVAHSPDEWPLND